MAILSPDDPLYQVLDEEQRRREQMDLANVAQGPQIPTDLGSYKGREIQSADPNFRARQEALTAMREQELARLQGLSNATRGDSLRALALAGQYATPGGVATGQLPDAQPYIGVYNNDYNRNANISNSRVAGAENDENRISAYIKNAYDTTKAEEQTDYSRSQDALRNKREEEQMAMSRDRFGFEKEKFGWEKEKYNASMKPELVGVSADGNQTIWRDPKSGEFITGDGKIADAPTLASLRPIGGKADDYVFEKGADGQIYAMNKRTGTGKATGLQGPKDKSDPMYKYEAEQMQGAYDAAAGANAAIASADRVDALVDKINKDSVVGTGAYNDMAKKVGSYLPGNMFDYKEREQLQNEAAVQLSTAIQSMRGLGSMSDRDLAAMKEQLATGNYSPETIKYITGRVRTIAQYNQEKLNAWRQGGKGSGKTFQDWSTDYDSANYGKINSNIQGGGITGKVSNGSVNQGQGAVQDRKVVGGSSYVKIDGKWYKE